MSTEPALIKTYSLEEVAAMVLPPEWKDGARWLRRKISAGEIGGYKLSRGQWRMTHGDVVEMVERRLHNTLKPLPRRVAAPEPEPPATVSLPDSERMTFLEGLTPRSRARVLNSRARER